VKAIEIRNAIAHASIGADRQPKLWPFSREQLSRAFEEVRVVFERYVTVVERGEPL
jgi:hypothetical protein